MGMTIDKAIKHGKEQLEIFGGEHNEFIQTAVDTMRKYQKINEIVKNTDRNADTVRNALAFGDIAKVVEDGNEAV